MQDAWSQKIYLLLAMYMSRVVYIGAYLNSIYIYIHIYKVLYLSFHRLVAKMILPSLLPAPPSFDSDFLSFFGVFRFWQSFGSLPFSSGRGNGHWTAKGNGHESPSPLIACFPSWTLKFPFLPLSKKLVLPWLASPSSIGRTCFPSFPTSCFPFLYFLFPSFFACCPLLMYLHVSHHRIIKSVSQFFPRVEFIPSLIYIYIYVHMYMHIYA